MSVLIILASPYQMRRVGLYAYRHRSFGQPAQHHGGGSRDSLFIIRKSPIRQPSSGMIGRTEGSQSLLVVMLLIQSKPFALV